MTGTIIKNRTDLPDTIRSLAFRLSDNEVIAFRDNRLLVLGWRAAQKKKPLFMLTTDCCHSSGIQANWKSREVCRSGQVQLLYEWSGQG
jgi:hypothetical protein